MSEELVEEQAPVELPKHGPNAVVFQCQNPACGDYFMAPKEGKDAKHVCPECGAEAKLVEEEVEETEEEAPAEEEEAEEEPEEVPEEKPPE